MCIMVLDNKLGIVRSPDFSREEGRISKKKAIAFFDSGMRNRLAVGTFFALKVIHKHFFDKIYDFAGEIRKVNLSKGKFCFMSLMCSEETLSEEDRLMLIHQKIYRFFKGDNVWIG